MMEEWKNGMIKKKTDAIAPKSYGVAFSQFGSRHSLGI